MPRPFGVVLLAAASLLCGVYAWFGLIWLVGFGVMHTRAPMLAIAMFALAPHMAGWFVALGIGVVVFVLGFRFARRRGLAWLGFAANPAPNPRPERVP